MGEKNWMGMDCHPTDSYLDKGAWWKGDVRGRMEKYRKLYDVIADAGFKTELDDLMELAFDAGALDQIVDQG